MIFLLRFVKILTLLFYAMLVNAQQDINDIRFAEALNLHKQGAFAQSTLRFQLDLDTAQQQQDWEMYFDAKNWIAKNYWKQELLDSAKMEINSILDNIVEKLGEESLAESQTYNELGVVYDKERDYTKALEAYQTCLAIRKEKLEPDALPLGQVYFNIGSCYNLQDKIKQGLMYYEKAKFSFEKSLPANHLNIGWVYQNLGASYTKIRDYDKALENWKKALAIFLENYGPENPRVGIAYNDMASILVMKDNGNNLILEEQNQILDWLGKSFSIMKNFVGEKHPYIANIYVAMGLTLSKKDNFEKGWSYLKKAEQILLEIEGEKGESLATCYSNMAYAYFQEKNYEKAIFYAHKGILANCPEYSDTARFDLPDLDKAILFSPTLMFQLLEYTIKGFGNLYKVTNRVDYKEAFEQHVNAYGLLCNRLLKEFSNPGDQEFVANIEISNYSRTASYFYDFGDVESLFRFSEESKSIFLKQALDYASAKELGGIPDDLRKEELTLQKAIAEQNAKIINASKTHNDSLIQGMKSELFEHKDDLNDFITKLEKNYPEYYELKYQTKGIDIATIQEKILDEETLLLEYFMTNDAIYVFAISKNEVKTKKIDKLKKVNALLADLRATISSLKLAKKDPKRAWAMYTNSAYGLYELFVSDFIANQSIKKIIIIPDKSLGRVPFETFLTKAVTGQKTQNYNSLDYLVKDYAIQYVYSASLLLHENQHKHHESGHLLAVAASYNPTATSFETTDKTQLAFRKDLLDLPGAKKEVEHLEKYKGTYLFGENANETVFKNTDFTKYSIVHLAMHGLMDKKNPMLSSLVFSEKLDSVEDDFLYAYELTNMHIPCELIVLSACETGDGSLSATEGIMSLARSCMYAGIPSVLMTLWQVNDESTSIIVDLFYENLHQGMTKSTALRKAKLKYIDLASDLIAHPVFWAPLVSLGDDSPILLYKKSTFRWYWILALAFLCLIVLVVRNKKKQVA